MTRCASRARCCMAPMARDFSTGSPGPGVACSTGSERSRREPVIASPSALARLLAAFPPPTPDPTDARGLQYLGGDPGGALGADYVSRSGLPVINIAGCAPHPGWIMETLLALSLGVFDRADMDSLGRPRLFADHLAHHGCGRNEFYEFKASAERFSERGCLMENLGCKATQAVGDCNQRSWNGGGSCTQVGSTCIACTSPSFENTRGFLQTPKLAGIPIGLPLDMPKAWFVALAALSKSATPRRVRAEFTLGSHRFAAGSRREEGKMSRIVIGPFNRVEGDLEVTLDVDAGTVRQAFVSAPLYRGFEQILIGRPAEDALAIAPRICGICSVSQSLAVAAVLRAARKCASGAQRLALDQHRPCGGKHRRPSDAFLPVLHAGFRARGLCGAALVRVRGAPLQGDAGNEFARNAPGARGPAPDDGAHRRQMAAQPRLPARRRHAGDRPWRTDAAARPARRFPRFPRKDAVRRASRGRYRA